MNKSILFLFLSACGSQSTPACFHHEASAVWTTGSDVLTLDAVCNGSDSFCNSTFTWSPITATKIEIKVSSTNNNTGCPRSGTWQCQYDVSGDVLAFSCGQGTSVFNRYVSNN